MVVFELTFGVLGDMFGRKRLLLGGALLIVVGAALCASAQEVHLMWIGQAIAGIGAGALYPISLAMIAAAAPTPRPAPGRSHCGRASCPSVPHSRR